MPTPRPTAGADVLAEHQHLRSLVGQLEVILDAPVLAASRLAPLLTDLMAALQDHFAHEEEGGLFESVRAARPARARACRLLLAEHGAFLARLDRLIASAADPQPSWREAARAFLADLSRHEREENALVAEAVDPQGGAPD